jgi:hypothetical protein
MKRLGVLILTISLLNILLAAQLAAQTAPQAPAPAGAKAPAPPAPPQRSTFQRPPQATIESDIAKATLWQPDPLRGYYRGTRFDWAGVVSNYSEKGTKWFGSWFVKSDPTVEDMRYDRTLNGWVAGINSASMGPVNEFSATSDTLPPGYKEAPEGGTFLKIGVGMLRKPKETTYNRFNIYEIANGGKWTTNFKPGSDQIEFVHKLDDPSGYGYVYTKTASIAKGKPDLVVEQSLKNTGSKLIDTDVCVYTFLTADNANPSDNGELNFHFPVKVDMDKVNPGYIKAEGTEVQFLKELQGDEKLDFNVQGFIDASKSFHFRYRSASATMGVVFDQSLSGLGVTVIKSALIYKFYYKLHVEPGSEFKWHIAYQPYILRPAEPEPAPAGAKPAPAATKPAPAAAKPAF